MYQHPPIKTTRELLARYGNPFTHQLTFEKKWMILYSFQDLVLERIECLPRRVYINRDIEQRLESTIYKLIASGLHKEIKTWDGCFNVRRQRGSSAISRHAFGIALDMNAAWNKLYGKVSWTQDFLNVWRNEGWICGADFHSRSDGMHMENTAYNAW